MFDTNPVKDLKYRVLNIEKASQEYEFAWYSAPFSLNKKIYFSKMQLFATYGVDSPSKTVIEFCRSCLKLTWCDDA